MLVYVLLFSRFPWFAHRTRSNEYIAAGFLFQCAMIADDLEDPLLRRPSIVWPGHAGRCWDINLGIQSYRTSEGTTGSLKTYIRVLNTSPYLRFGTTGSVGKEKHHLCHLATFSETMSDFLAFSGACCFPPCSIRVLNNFSVLVAVLSNSLKSMESLQLALEGTVPWQSSRVQPCPTWVFSYLHLFAGMAERC